MSDEFAPPQLMMAPEQPIEGKTILIPVPPPAPPPPPPPIDLKAEHKDALERLLDSVYGAQGDLRVVSHQLATRRYVSKDSLRDAQRHLAHVVYVAGTLLDIVDQIPFVPPAPPPQPVRVIPIGDLSPDAFYEAAKEKYGVDLRLMIADLNTHPPAEMPPARTQSVSPGSYGQKEVEPPVVVLHFMVPKEQTTCEEVKRRWAGFVFPDNHYETVQTAGVTCTDCKKDLIKDAVDSILGQQLKRKPPKAKKAAAKKKARRR